MKKDLESFIILSFIIRIIYIINQDEAKAEDIFTSTKTLRKWVNRWLNEGTISNKISAERRLKNIKITTDDLLRLDRAVFKKRDLSARLVKTKLNLEMSSRSIQRYLNKMGWKKIETMCSC